MKGYNWFLNLFVDIPRRSIIVGFLTLLEKNRFNPYTVWDQLFMTTGSEVKAQALRMPQICMAACLPLFYTPAWRSNTCNSAFQTENAGIENREYETRRENFLTPRLARELCKITSFTPATLTELKGKDDIPLFLDGKK
jgi:hypothetical protein